MFMMRWHMRFLVLKLLLFVMLLVLLLLLLKMFLLLQCMNVMRLEMHVRHVRLAMIGLMVHELVFHVFVV